MNDVVTKEEFRGKRNINNKDKHFHGEDFHEKKQHKHFYNEIDLDEDNPYSDLIDIHKIK